MEAAHGPIAVRVLCVSIMRNRLRLFQAVNQPIGPVHRLVHRL